MWHLPRPDNSRAIKKQINRIEAKVDAIMSEQSQQQADINSAAAFDQQLDADVKALTAQVTAGQAALDQAIPPSTRPSLPPRRPSWQATSRTWTRRSRRWRPTRTSRPPPRPRAASRKGRPPC